MTTVTDIDNALRCGRPACPCMKGRNRHCPVVAAHSHGDAEPSLTLKITGDRILFNCKTGCAQDDVIASLAERKLWPPEADLTPRNTPRTRRRTHFTKEWAYLDRGGNAIAWHGRFDYDDGTGKEFLWRLAAQQWGERNIGLGELSISELPLYNADLVALEDDEIVFVVEGEKAADACVEHGLVAVALGGGASQKEFGVCLEPLLRREVVLWPDNDEPGAALMARIAAMLPQAKFLNPPDLPPKGDAFDFFAAGRTVAEIRTLTKTPEPTIRVTDEDTTIEIPVPAGTVTFVFDDINASENAVEAQLVVTPHMAGVKTTEPFSGRINCVSLSQREAFRRMLDSMYGKDHDWTRHLNTATRLATEAYSNQVTAVDIAEIALSYDMLYAVGGFMPEKQMTVLFGLGGAGKTETALSLAACCILGIPWLGHSTGAPRKVMFVDYEADGATVRRRLQRIFQGMGFDAPPVGMFAYYEAKGIPLPMQARRLKREARRFGAEVIIVDSAAAACGGEPEKAGPTLAFFNAVKQIGATTLVVAHVRKPDTATKSTQWKMQPFGSAFWHNNARATWYEESIGAPSRNELNVILTNRKMNDDRLQGEFSFHISFAGGEGAVALAVDARPAEELRPPRTMSETIESLWFNLNGGAPLTVREIHAECEMYGNAWSEASVRNALNRGRGDVFARLEAVDADGGLWALASYRSDEDAPPDRFQGEFQYDP